MGTFPDISIPSAVARVAHVFASRGYDAVIVGGAVRDALLDVETTDFDLVTTVSPSIMRDVLASAEDVRSVYALGERFGTIGAALAEGGHLEITQMRAEAAALETTTARFAADAAHRDFTVNAMGYDLARDELLDPENGLRDLSAGVLRTPGQPAERFGEDPIRVLRAARFVAELGFTLDAVTTAAMPRFAPGLAEVSAERVRDELTKLLVGRDAARGIGVLRDSGALAVILPEVAALDGLAQPTFHDLDAFAHTLQSLELSPATPVMRWAALLHDIGKAPTRTVEPDGRIRFFQHAHVGAQMAERVCRRMRMSNADIAAIVHLVAEHMRLGAVNLDNARSVDRAVRKLDLRLGAAATGPTVASAEDAVALTVADFGATAHRDQAPLLAEALAAAVEQSRERGTATRVRSPLSGKRLMHELHLAEGPAVGLVKAAVERAIIEGRLAPDDVDGALRIAGAALGYHSADHSDDDEREQ